MSTMNRDEFHAALGRLDALSKGQLFHTASDSNPGTWAGTGQEDQDEHSDGIDENGTDYNGVKKSLAAKIAKSKALTPGEVAIVQGNRSACRKSIGDKIAKGSKLTQAESWALTKGFPFGKDEDKDDDAEKSGMNKADEVAKTKKDSPAIIENDEDSKIEPDAKKSLGGAIAGTEHLKKGIEMSPILAEFARAMGVALEGVEARTAARVTKSLVDVVAPLVGRVENIEKSLGAFSGVQGEFNKSFAEAMLGIGQQVAGSVEVASQAATGPVGGPRSQLRAIPGGQGQQGVQAVQKSFGAGGLDTSGEAFAKSQITDTMFELVKGGQLNQLDLVKFESSGEMNPAVRQMVVGKLNAAGGAR